MNEILIEICEADTQTGKHLLRKAGEGLPDGHTLGGIVFPNNVERGVTYRHVETGREASNTLSRQTCWGLLSLSFFVADGYPLASIHAQPPSFGAGHERICMQRSILRLSKHCGKRTGAPARTMVRT